MYHNDNNTNILISLVKQPKVYLGNIAWQCHADCAEI